MKENTNKSKEKKFRKQILFVLLLITLVIISFFSIHFLSKIQRDQSEEEALSLHWSNKKNIIYYTATDSKGNYSLRQINTLPGKYLLDREINLSQVQSATNIFWGPNNKILIFDQPYFSNSSWPKIINLNQKKSTTPISLPETEKIAKWSPDGESIAYVRKIENSKNKNNISLYSLSENKILTSHLSPENLTDITDIFWINNQNIAIVAQPDPTDISLSLYLLDITVRELTEIYNSNQGFTNYQVQESLILFQTTNGLVLSNFEKPEEIKVVSPIIKNPYETTCQWQETKKIFCQQINSEEQTRDFWVFLIDNESISSEKILSVSYQDYGKIRLSFTISPSGKNLAYLNENRKIVISSTKL